MTQHILVDIESTGTVCPIYSMVQLGAVHHENPSNTFFGTLKPINENASEEAMKYTGLTWEEVSEYNDVQETMDRFLSWVKQIQSSDSRVIFVSDTTAFDFSFVSFYLWFYCGENPFGHAPLSINNLWRGITGGTEYSANRFRKTKHDHHALRDAVGNQEAFTVVLRELAKQKVRWKSRQN